MTARPAGVAAVIINPTEAYTRSDISLNNKYGV